MDTFSAITVMFPQDLKWLLNEAPEIFKDEYFSAQNKHGFTLFHNCTRNSAVTSPKTVLAFFDKFPVQTAKALDIKDKKGRTAIDLIDRKKYNSEYLEIVEKYNRVKSENN